MSSFGTVDGIGDNKEAKIDIEKLKVTPTRPTSFLLPLFQEGQLSFTGESMCTKYWLTAYEV